MSDEIKKITLNERAYSHQGTGRNGVYYTLMVDGEPLQLDSWINPDARKYAYLFKAAPDLLDVLEGALRTCEDELEYILDDLRLRDRMREAIAKAKGGGQVMSEKRLAKDLKQGDVISFGGHYGPGDDIVKSVIKCPEGVIIYTERGGEFSVSENTAFDFVGSERRLQMTEIERLRADLEVIERYVSDHIDIREAEKAVKLKIAEIEKAAADQWRNLREALSDWDGALDNGKVIGKKACDAASQLETLLETNDRLTAEVFRLGKRVAELEAAASDVTALLETTDEASDPSTDTYVAVAIANAAIADMQPPRRKHDRI